MISAKMLVHQIEKNGHSHDPDLKDGNLALVISNSAIYAINPQFFYHVGLWKSEKKMLLGFGRHFVGEIISRPPP